MKLKRSLTLVLALVMTVCLAACINTPADPDATYHSGIDVNPDYAGNYASVFSGDKIVTVNITVDANNYAAMLSEPEAETFYSADVKIENESITKAGFRTSGNTDLSEFDADTQTRFCFKIKFDKYVEKQKFLKLDEMSLLNLNGDPSYMRIYIALNAYRALGCDAPYCTFAKLYINGTYTGLYLAVEGVDDAFLKRVYGNNDGTLYKAMEGADLYDSASLSLLDQKNGTDKSKEDLDTLITTLAAMPYGEKGDIESILNVDNVLRYLAVTTGLGIYKSYLSKNPDNYYLSCNDGKFTIIPWDVKSAFGAANKDNGATVTLSPYEPVYRTTMDERPLASKLLAVPEYLAAYESYVAKVREYLDGVEAQIEKLDALIGSSVQEDPTAFYSYEQYLVSIGRSDASGNTTGIVTLAEYAALRRDYLVSVNF